MEMDFFKGRLQASEGSFHKKEQEFALQQLRKKLVEGGTLSAEALKLGKHPPYHTAATTTLAHHCSVRSPCWSNR